MRRVCAENAVAFAVELRGISTTVVDLGHRGRAALGRATLTRGC